ncbi:MAG: hypothetical protein ACTSV2_11480 [Candidatus Thorarchaeota archaeon]
MNEFGGEWNCSIPAQVLDSEVVYRVYAWDTLGNLGISEAKSYLTQAGIPPPLPVLLIAGAGAAVVLVVAGITEVISTPPLMSGEGQVSIIMRGAPLLFTSLLGLQ